MGNRSILDAVANIGCDLNYLCGDFKSKEMKGIFIQNDWSDSREVYAICQANNELVDKFEVRRGDQSQDLIDDGEDHMDWLHIGSVEFVEGAFSGIAPKPDFYPKWAADHLHREIETRTVFVKDANKYKGMDTFVKEVHISEPVTFVDEWRYYVANGQSICNWWYQGNHDDCDKEPHGPELPMDIPVGWCGSIDMGRLDTGEFALVECHHPYAIGWYGEMVNARDYFAFMVSGWQYL